MWDTQPAAQVQARGLPPAARWAPMWGRHRDPGWAARDPGGPAAERAPLRPGREGGSRLLLNPRRRPEWPFQRRRRGRGPFPGAPRPPAPPPAFPRGRPGAFSRRRPSPVWERPCRAWGAGAPGAGGGAEPRERRGRGPGTWGRGPGNRRGGTWGRGPQEQGEGPQGGARAREQQEGTRGEGRPQRSRRGHGNRGRGGVLGARGGSGGGPHEQGKGNGVPPLAWGAGPRERRGVGPELSWVRSVKVGRVVRESRGG